MASPRILILRAPGTNCDQETAFAFELAGGRPEVVHLNRILEAPNKPDDYQILCIPGGFSYGDDIAAGKIFANQLRLRVCDALVRFHQSRKLILGICNGFQVLLKAGLLPSVEAEEQVATLTWNDSGRFEDRWVELATHGDRCVLLSGIDRMYLPVAHAEGKFVTKGPEQLKQLSSSGQLAVRYAWADNSGTNGPLPFPANPNGSLGNVAGVCDESGRILGLMPHPERYIQRTQHPRWTRERLGEIGDGLRIFENAVQFFL